MAYRFTMELGEAALEVNLLPVVAAVVWPGLTAGSGAAGVVVVEVRDGLTGTGGSTLVWGCWREVLLAATGAVAVVVVLAGLGWLTAVVVVVDGVVTALAVEAVEVVASLALFSALIRSISSGSWAAAAGLAGVTIGLGAAGLGAGGGVSFFLGRVSSISRSWELEIVSLSLSS